MGLAGAVGASDCVWVDGCVPVCIVTCKQTHTTPRHATLGRPPQHPTHACLLPARSMVRTSRCPVWVTQRPLSPLPPQPFPDPKSQSFSRSYGSVLPTSLTHIILVTRGCSPWRPAADMSTDSQGNDHLPLIFKDCYRHTRHLRDGRCSSNHLTLSPDNLIQGSSKKRKKETRKKKEIPPKESERERERERERGGRRRRRRRRNRERGTREKQERERERGKREEERDMVPPPLPTSLPTCLGFPPRSAPRLALSFFLSPPPFFFFSSSFSPLLCLFVCFFFLFFSFMLDMIVKKKRELFLGSVPACQGSIVLPQHILRLVQEY